MLDWLAPVRQWLSRSRVKSNRRRYVRKPFTAPIEIRVPSGIVYRGVSRDLSEFGMGAIISAPLAVGDGVSIKYDHPASAGSVRNVVREAVVKQKLGYRFGFEFEFKVAADDPQR